LEPLRRWHRELKARDVFGAPAAIEADQQLKHCAERLEDYTERVFTALHQMSPTIDTTNHDHHGRKGQ